MEHITIGQITNAITLIMVIVGAFATIYKFVHDAFFDKLKCLEGRLVKLEEETERQGNDIKDSKEERLLLMQGLLACLKGLKEQGCNGPVTQGIIDIEEYITQKSHK